MPPPQRPPSSPTSLLWAHQLKREHGFLLNRMKKLEAEIAGVETRTQEAAGSARADDVAKLARKVQRLTDDGGHAAMEKIRGEVMEKFEDVGAEIEAVTIQVSNLERGQEGMKEEGKRARESERALLRRIKEVEGSMREYERGVVKLGRKIDELAVGKIREMLEGLRKDVEEEKVGLEVVKASLEKLGEAGRVLQEGSEKLEEQVKELAERPVHLAAPEPVVAAEHVAKPAVEHHEPKEDEDSSAETPLPPQKAKAAKKKVPKAAATSTRKPAPKRAAAKTQRAPQKGTAATKKAARETQEPQIDVELKKPIVRRGRGWIEVEEDEDEEEEGADQEESIR